MPLPPQIDTDLLKRSATGRWVDILSSLGGIPASILDGSHGPCPKCGGTDRFRMLDQGAGGLYCNQCFNSRNGDGISALQWLTGMTFQQSAAKIAEYLGVIFTTTAAATSTATDATTTKKAACDSHLEFLPWNEAVAGMFCVKKPGVTPAAILAAGGKIARFKIRISTFTVIAIPQFAPEQITATADSALWTPCGWVVWNTAPESPINPTTGKPTNPALGNLPRCDKYGQIMEWSKMKSTQGSKAGMMMMHGLERLSPAHPGRAKIDVVWKTGGPTDAMALWNLIPESERDSNVVLTSGGGEGQNVRPAMAELFRGLCVYVVHDADKIGEAGAAKWLQSIGPIAAEVRQVRLPYPITENHGKDIRDWMMEL